MMYISFLLSCNTSVLSHALQRHRPLCQLQKWSVWSGRTAWRNTVLRFSAESHGVTCSLPNFEKSTYSLFLSLSSFKVVKHDNTKTCIIELLWASGVGEAHRTLSAPSKCSINVGSISKSNPFFLIIHDLVVGTWPTYGWRDKKTQLGSLWVKHLCWSNSHTKNLFFASACCGVWLWPLMPFCFQPEIKGNMRMTGQRWENKKQLIFMAKISCLLYLSWI